MGKKTIREVNRDKAGVVERWRTETHKALEELKRLVRVSPLSQHAVEKRAGFSSGYLSQLLAQNLDLKVWHVLAILDAVEASPGDFFRRVYPAGRRRFPALERFQRSSQPLSQETDQLLGELYGQGVASLDELRERLRRCENAVSELEASGILSERRRAERGESS